MGRRAIPREAILENLRAVARALGKKVLACEDYKRHPLRRFCLASIFRHCQGWGNALHEAGLAPAQVHRKAGQVGARHAAPPQPEPSDGGCPRCCGLFGLASSLDEHGSPMQLWRCVNCGEVLDDKIKENRMLCQPKERRLRGQWPPRRSPRLQKGAAA
jgi:hypothetical protein